MTKIPRNHRIARQRRFKPTSRGWLLLCSAVIWFLVAVINHKPLPALFACGGFSLFLASFFTAFFSLRNLSLSRGPIGEAASAQAVSMPVTIVNNSSHRSQNLVICEDCPFTVEKTHYAVVPSLAPGETRHVNRRILALKRGEFDLEAIRVRSGDPAGLFFKEIEFEQPRRLLVVPGSETIRNIPLQPRETITGASGSPLSTAGTSQDIYAIREYNPSDGMRYIHWKSSAKFGKMMVREFERNAVTSVALLLDGDSRSLGGPEHWNNFEYQVRAAAGITRYLSELYCNLAFGAGGDGSIMVSSKPAGEVKDEVLYELAKVQPGKTDLPTVAYSLCERLLPGTLVFCLSLSENESIRKAMEVLDGQGMQIRWLCAEAGAFTGGKVREPVKKSYEFSVIHLAPQESVAGVLAHA